MGITAADLMTRKVITLIPEMTLNEMDTVLMKRGVSGAPVVEHGRLVGVVSAKLGWDYLLHRRERRSFSTSGIETERVA